MGTGLHIKGEPATEEQISELFESAVTDAETEATPKQEKDTPETGGDFSFGEFTHFQAPKSSGGRKKLGPDDKEELAEFFTQDGIGSIVARGLNAFFRACDAEPMEQAESNNVAKVTAYYCRARLPKGAGAYQPELLLFATLAMAILPRMGPIADKTAPFWRRMWDKARGAFKRGEDHE